MSASEIPLVKPLVPGPCSGEVLVLDRYLSFFGEVDPETGCLRDENTCLAGKVLVFKGSRGSTVGPYVLYALKKSNRAPLCMIVDEVDTLLVAGCVIAEIPLYIWINKPRPMIPNGTVVTIVEHRGGLYRVEERI